MISYVRTGVETDVGVGTTGGAVADLPNSGFSFLSAREVYTLQPPTKGCRKVLICVSTSTGGGTVVRASTGTSINIYSAGSRTNTQTSFALASTGAQMIELIGLSSVAWIEGFRSVIAASAAGLVTGTS